VSAEGFAQFRDAVLDDVVLQAELLSVPERRRFVQVVVARARARGCDVDTADVEGALLEGRCTRYARWV
jgi:hypothetical protein